MMTQRTRDFGLIKAAGCPNSLVGGYFLTELIVVALIGCILGTVGGFVADFAASLAVFGAFLPINLWFFVLVFGVFFGLALFFGLKPILKASKLSAAEALSPASYYGLFVTRKYKPLNRSALALRVASRSMARRLNPVIRIVILLSAVFILLTVSVAGGIIAKDTTTSWVQSSSSGTIAVAYSAMGSQYERLLSTFSGTESGDFNYSDPALAVPTQLQTTLAGLSGVSSVQQRLVLYENVTEKGNFTVIEGAMTSVGGQRESQSIVIGVNPIDLALGLVSKGRTLSASGSSEAIIGDSLTQTMYVADKKLEINYADPLVESIKIRDRTYPIVGVLVDPLNNGYVTYVPIEKLINSSGLSGPNLLLVTLDGSVNSTTVLEELRSAAKNVDSGLEVFDLSPTLQKNTEFLSSTWETIMLIPLLSVGSAAVCLVAYMMLVVDEQRQEFATLRAVGARARLIVSASAFESMLVLLSSFGVGLSFGIITTVLILMTNPVITGATIAVISGWLVAALAAMFVFSLYPAIKLSRTRILQMAS
jgi:ABC-type antimicrobial peptide transport system permease subunit